METVTVQKALILGGGPTTLDINRWVDIDRDFTMTMSTGYMNSTIQQTNIDYFIISTQTDFTCDEFKRWHQTNPNCQFVIESNHLWKTPKGMSDFKFNSLPIRIVVNERYRLGIMARAIMWLISIKQFSDIYFVGFDGYSPSGKAQHSFLHDTKELNPVADFNSYEQYYTSFLQYYNDVLLPETDTRLHNLGHGHPANILTRIANERYY